MIVVDTSVIMAILLHEEHGVRYVREIEEHIPVLISTGSAIELATVASRRAGLFDSAMQFLKMPYVRIEPVDSDQVAVAAKADRRFGKGHHPARLNLGDLFAYALAQCRGLPLLFQGSDFAMTDITPAAIAANRHPAQLTDLDRDESPIIHRRSRS